MKTKFIGLEGFNEIEGLNEPKKRRGSQKELNTAQKTVRFIKRASRMIFKSKKRKKVERRRSVLDRQYMMNRQNASGNAAMESLNYFRHKQAVSKHAHAAPTPYRTHGFVKKRAVLAVAASLTAVLLTGVTVASALDAPKTEPQKPEAKPVIAAATVDEAKNVKYDLENPGMYASTALSSLYIDNELIGTTAETDKLDYELDQVLGNARAKYDDTTTTTFNNEVYVDRHSYDSSELMTADEIMAKAEGKFSVRLETDWSYDVELDYESIVTYDENEDSSYSKVITEGKKGIEQVDVRLVYIDGEFYEANIIDSTVKQEPVNEELVLGSKQGAKESAAPASATGEASGSFIWPLPYTHNITSHFEWRWGRMHQGVDIADGDVYGQPIIAADGGKVTWSGNDGGGYGNYVMIDHGNGLMTVYGHASELACSTGDYVAKGETIAYVGSTGNSTGPHLHFEIRVNGEQVNPLEYVS